MISTITSTTAQKYVASLRLARHVATVRQLLWLQNNWHGNFPCREDNDELTDIFMAVWLHGRPYTHHAILKLLSGGLRICSQRKFLATNDIWTFRKRILSNDGLVPFSKIVWSVCPVLLSLELADWKYDRVEILPKYPRLGKTYQR
jgi:hypothetical protein